MEKTYKTFRIIGIDWLQKYIDPENEVIDFGCGLMPATRKLNCKKLIAIEKWFPYVNQLRKELFHLKHIHVWELALAGPFLSNIESNSTDISLAIDVVEHFEKEDALRLIKHMERISRKRVIIFTPEGFVPNEREENTELQRHRCGFLPIELEEIGYEVFKRIGGDMPSFLAVKEL